MSAQLHTDIPARVPSAPMFVQHGHYRPDVDGLRALAILSVIVFHAEPTLLPGGFVGVDVFFVISGFLISGIILRALARGEFNLLDFYSRRIKRIFPALITMLAGVWLLGWLILLPDEYQLLGKHIAAGGGFMLNLSLFTDTREYFGAIHTPLVHLWSLGVEEQFYLIWPLLLLVTAKMRRGQLLVMSAVGVASFIANVMLVNDHSLAAFYLPFCRLWELCLGSVLAHADLNGGGRLSAFAAESWIARILSPARRSVLGFLLVIASFALLDTAMSFPGWWALAPCMGAALMISAGPDAAMNRLVLSLPLMVGIGLISYPLYLWHWPLLSLAHTADWTTYTPTVKVVAVAISFLLAWLTYRFLELPIRTSRRIRPVAAGLGATMALGIVAGLLVFVGYAKSRPVPEEVDRFVRASTEAYPYPDEEGILTLASSGEMKTGLMKTGDRSTAPGGSQVLFLGDSTIAQYQPRIARLLEERPGAARSAVIAWRAGCAPDVEMSLVDPPACQALIEEALEYARRPQVDTVVIGFCWYAYFTGIIDDGYVGLPGPLVPGTTRVLDDLEKMVAGLRAAGKQVYLILQTPLDPSFDPKLMIRRSLKSPGFHIAAPAPMRVDISRTFEPFISRLRQIASNTGAGIIDPMEALCDSDTCRAVTAGGEPVYRDSFHIRKDYVRDNVRYLDSVIMSDRRVAQANGTP
jgi:peptidoglycan/LPS O-acetylase OafA/YrhL